MAVKNNKDLLLKVAAERLEETDARARKAEQELLQLKHEVRIEKIAAAMEAGDIHSDWSKGEKVAWLKDQPDLDVIERAMELNPGSLSKTAMYGRTDSAGGVKDSEVNRMNFAALLQSAVV